MAFSFLKSRLHHQGELADQEMIAFFEPGVDLEGKLSFSTGLIRANGHIKGEIRCEGTIVVGDQGEIEAEIHTKAISIGGKVKGTIHAGECLEIKEHGVVLGDIDTPCLIVEPGGYFSGRCHMPPPEPSHPILAELASKPQADQERSL